MRDGYWINWETGKTLEMPIGGDHEVFIRQISNAKALSVPIEVYRKFKSYRIGESHDRHEFLVWLFRSAPLIRIRGHNVYTTFNYAAKNNTMPYRVIQKFVKRVCGPTMLLEVVNFYETKPQGMRVFPHQFEALVKKQQKTSKGRIEK